MNKTYFVYNRFDGCSYYRCLMPQRENGWRGDKDSLGSDRITPQESANNVAFSDVVVFQRPDDESRINVAWLLKRQGKKIVFENDDTYKVDDPMKFGYGLKKRQDILDKFIKISDLVITSTEFLADEYRLINKNVVVCPNSIDQLDWPTPKRNESNIVRIGVVGSAAMNKDFYSIKGLIKELSERKDVRVVLFSLPRRDEDTKIVQTFYQEEFSFWDSLDVERHNFVEMKDYFKTLNNLELDIMLIPREDNYFNRCKSNVKFLEASMLEIPVIAQGFSDGKSPYQGEEDSKYMLICQTEEEYKGTIEELVKEKDLRREMGKKAKEYVLENYHISKTAKIWREAIERL